MSRAVIRLGDPTSHGGRVITASARMTIDGIPVALWGDRCSCPITGHDNCVICEGEPEAIYDGIPVALEGHKTSCGASLIATQVNRCHVSPLVKPSAVARPALAVPLGKTTEVFDEQVQLVDSRTKQPLADLEYRIETSGGKSYTGRTGPDGKTMRVQTDTAEPLRVFLVR